MTDRSRPLQIYMKPGIREDDLMLRVWDACRRVDRPQDVFRSMLRAGLLKMIETGEMPESIIEECGLEHLLERHRRRTATAGAGHPVHPHMPYPHYAPPAYPAMPQPAWQPQQQPEAVRDRAPELVREAVPAKPAAVTEPTPKTPDAAPSSVEPATPSPNKPKGRIGNLM